MEASVLFLSCPAYLDERGTVRCGLLAEVEEVYSLPSTDGPVESARIRCPAGHYFNGPVEVFCIGAPPRASAVGQLSERR